MCIFKLLSFNYILTPEIILKIRPVLHLTQRIIRITNETLENINIKSSKLIQTHSLLHDLAKLHIAKPALGIHITHSRK